jgi:hypothetical protein
MKIIAALIFLCLSNMAFANVSCDVKMISQYSNQTYEINTGYARSYSEACREAFDNCHESISRGQTYGRYYDAICVSDSTTPTYPTPRPPRPPETPYPPTRELTCRTDLVDFYGNTIRSFNGFGRTPWEACQESDRLCSYMTQNNRMYCQNRGIQNGGGHRPGRLVTEYCQAERFDPAGHFIESYTGSHTGPVGTDVRGEACREAHQKCSMYLRGAQYCRTN